MPHPDTAQNPTDYGRVRQPYQGAVPQPSPAQAPETAKPAAPAKPAKEG